MGNSASQPEEKKEETRASTDDEKEQIKKYSEMLSGKLDGLKKQYDDFTKSPTFETFFDVFGSKVDPEVTPLEQLQSAIKSCKESHIFLKQLQKCDEIMTDFKPRVDKALEIHETQWDLLRESLFCLLNLKNQIEDTKYAIEDWMYEINKGLKGDQIDMSNIEKSMNTLGIWFTNCDEVTAIATKWRNLAKIAQEEENKWISIRAEIKKRVSKRKWFYRGVAFGGFVVIAGLMIGLVCACPATAAAAPALGEAAATVGFVLLKSYVIAVGISALVIGGVAVSVAYATDKDFKMFGAVSDLSSKMALYMGQAATNGKLIQKMMDDLVVETVKQKQANKTINYNRQNIERVKLQLGKITDSLDEFDKQCDNTIKVIETTQHSIIGCSKQK